MDSKAGSSRPKTPQDYEMSLTPVTQNRFQILQDFPALTYSQATRTPISSQIRSIQQIPKTPEKSNENTYFTKPFHQHITITRFQEIPLYSTLNQLTQRIFPQKCFWQPDDPSKNLDYYELILTDTQSVEIFPIPDKKNPNIISHSKCIIKKVCSPNEWTSLYSKKSFSVRFIPDGFTYQDYKMAWYRAFLYRPFNHSWFFTFKENCNREFPIWFNRWWQWFGPQKEN